MYDALARTDIAPSLRALATRYDEVLKKHDPQALHAHPLSDVWSALEYACHMRDVYRVYPGDNSKVAPYPERGVYCVRWKPTF